MRKLHSAATFLVGLALVPNLAVASGFTLAPVLPANAMAAETPAPAPTGLVSLNWVDVTAQTTEATLAGVGVAASFSVNLFFHASVARTVTVRPSLVGPLEFTGDPVAQLCQSGHLVTASLVADDACQFQVPAGAVEAFHIPLTATTTEIPAPTDPDFDSTSPNTVAGYLAVELTSGTAVVEAVSNPVTITQALVVEVPDPVAEPRVAEPRVTDPGAAEIPAATVPAPVAPDPVTDVIDPGDNETKLDDDETPKFFPPIPILVDAVALRTEATPSAPNWFSSVELFGPGDLGAVQATPSDPLTWRGQITAGATDGSGGLAASAVFVLPQNGDSAVFEQAVTAGIYDGSGYATIGSSAAGGSEVSGSGSSTPGSTTESKPSGSNFGNPFEVLPPLVTGDGTLYYTELTTLTGSGSVAGPLWPTCQTRGASSPWLTWDDTAEAALLAAEITPTAFCLSVGSGESTSSAQVELRIKPHPSHYGNTYAIWVGAFEVKDGPTAPLPYPAAFRALTDDRILALDIRLPRAGLPPAHYPLQRLGVGLLVLTLLVAPVIWIRTKPTGQ